MRSASDPTSLCSIDLFCMPFRVRISERLSLGTRKNPTETGQSRGPSTPPQCVLASGCARRSATLGFGTRSTSLPARTPPGGGSTAKASSSPPHYIAPTSRAPFYLRPAGETLLLQDRPDRLEGAPQPSRARRRRLHPSDRNVNTGGPRARERKTTRVWFHELARPPAGPT